MRRKDREITDEEQILGMIRCCGVCRVAFHDAEYHYIVPLNFGIGEGKPLTLYFHCAAEGKKLDLMQRDNRVSFEMDCAHRLVTGSRACDTTMEYESVCGNGLLEPCGGQEKEQGLARVMAHYCGEKPYEFDAALLKHTVVLKLTVHTVTAKALKKGWEAL